MKNILNLVENKFGIIPFKYRGITITEELIISTVNILNLQSNKQLIQMATNAVVEKTPNGLDKEIKKALDTSLRTSNIISDVLEQVGLVEIFKSENPETKRMVNTTKLIFKID